MIDANRGAPGEHCGDPGWLFLFIAERAVHLRSARHAVGRLRSTTVAEQLAQATPAVNLVVSAPLCGGLSPSDGQALQRWLTDDRPAPLGWV